MNILGTFYLTKVGQVWVYVEWWTLNYPLISIWYQYFEQQWPDFMLHSIRLLKKSTYCRNVFLKTTIVCVWCYSTSRTLWISASVFLITITSTSDTNQPEWSLQTKLSVTFFLFSSLLFFHAFKKFPLWSSQPRGVCFIYLFIFLPSHLHMLRRQRGPGLFI